MTSAALDVSSLAIGAEDIGALPREVLLMRLRGLILAEPGVARHQINLAVAASLMGEREGAAVAAGRAVRLDVGRARGHRSQAKALSGLGMSAPGETALRRALCLEPGDPEALEIRAESSVGSRDQVRIETAYHRVIVAAPDRARAWLARGLANAVLGRIAVFTQCLRRAVDLEPDDPTLASNIIVAFDHLLDRGVEEAQADRRGWWRRHGAPLLPAPAVHANVPIVGRRLRVGYVSADFRNHSATSVFAPVVLGHDPEAVDLVLYANNRTADAMTERFKARADTWRPVADLDDGGLARRIVEDRIDILVDLSGHSEGNRLLVFARKPAPIQVSAWGYALTTGLPAIDYFLTDPMGVPQAARHHLAETCVDLPCMVPFDLPADPPELSAPPYARTGTVTFGSFNRWSKITPATRACWARILTAVDGARLLIKAPSLDDPNLRDFVTADFAARGVSTDRLDLRGRTSRYDHLACHNEVDIVLDAFPHTGGVSTWEALFMGVPVVSKIGAGLPHRLSATILHVMDEDAWLAPDDAGYEALAIKAARDTARLASPREDLRERVRRNIGCDAVAYTRAVEAAYRDMWRRWCATAMRR